MDESHPVDIKVTWTLTNRLAIIEIKWLGKSRSKSGKLVKYADARANEGARQLADYLDWNRTQTLDRQTKGYLVVIDARRRGLTEKSTFVNHKNGMHYYDIEIVFKPAFHEKRTDFEKPIRMFAEPICRAD